MARGIGEKQQDNETGQFDGENGAPLLKQGEAQDAGHAPPEPRMSSFAIGVTFFSSFVFAFLFLAFPLGFSFVPTSFNLANTLLAVLLFVSRCVSLACYSTQWWKENKENKKNRREGRAEARIMKFDIFGVTNMKISTFAGIGFAIAVIVSLLLIPWDLLISGLARLSFDTVMKEISLTTAINTLFFILFTFGSFLSIAFRLREDGNKGDIEIKGARWAASISLLALLVAGGITWLGGNHFLDKLTALSGHSILGINVFLGLLLSLISITAYCGKALDLLWSGSTKNGKKNDQAREKRCKRKYWEYRGAVVGIPLGLLLAILVPAFHIHPFGGDLLVQIATSIMILAAFPSLFTELGRAFDEESRAAPEKQPIDVQIDNKLRFLAPALRFTLPIGLFVTLGFALSSLAGGYGLGLFTSPLFTFALAAIALVGIFTWKSLSHTSGVQAVPSHQALASVEPALKILNKLPFIQGKEQEQEREFLLNALRVHIGHAKTLLILEEDAASKQGTSRSALLRYNNKNWNDENFAAALEKDLSALKEADQSLSNQSDAGWNELREIFERLKAATIDPHHRAAAALSPQKKNLLLLGSVISTALALAFLGLILLGQLSVAAMPWIALLPAVFGFTSFICVRKWLNTMQGGPYAVLQALAVVSSAFFLGLTILGLAELPLMGLQIGYGWTIVFAIAAFISVEGVFLLGRKATQYADRLTLDSGSKNASRLLNVLKGIGVLALLGVAYSSIGLFSAEGLGSLRYFFQDILQLNPASLGLASIGIFAIAMCIAFELYKSILQPSPSQVSDIAASKDRIALGDFLFKLAVALPVVLLNKMTPAFVVLIFVMPFFSGRTQIPFSNKANARLAQFLGVGRYDAEGKEFSKKHRFVRECGVVSFLGLLVGISTLITGHVLGNVNVAGIISGIGMAVTLFSRWSMMWQAYCDPVMLAESRVQGSAADLPQAGGVGPLPTPVGAPAPASPSPSPSTSAPAHTPAHTPVRASAFTLA